MSRTSHLPIHEVLPAIRSALNERHELVLEAPPGAGKTTQVPLALLQESWLQGQKILLLEPRRLAARAAAERMAQLLGETVGETVGYRVRLESRIGPGTRIEVVTEGILNRQLQQDPSLEGIGLVIFDEFHERSLDADLGLALTRQGRELFGDLRDQPLKILVMSATLDGDQVSRFLQDAPLVRSEGRCYPVDIVYGQPWHYGERIAGRVVSTVLQALQEQAGSLLVFLPGQGEIRQVHELLQAQLQHRPELEICPLYGDLSLEQQRRAIEPCAAGRRKLVLATSIAETSLTIEGVRVVVDAGLSRQPQFDPATGMTRLTTQRVSRASASQRAGRAGRLEEGVCYRLWSQSQQDELAAWTPAEIQQADLAPLALQLLQWGVSELSELAWLETPPAAPYRQALELLQQLQAAEPIAGSATDAEPTRWRLTGLGQAMAALPTHPRLAHMILRAVPLGLAGTACELAALLSERDFVRDQGQDLQLRLDYLRGERRLPRHQQGLLSRLRQQQQQFERLLANIPAAQLPTDSAGLMAPDLDESLSVGLLVALAYPDRIARQRPGRRTEYQLSNGRAAHFAEQDSLCQYPWLAVAALGGQHGRSHERIFLASPLSAEVVEAAFGPTLREQVCIEWDEQEDKLVAERRRWLGRLLLDRQPLAEVPAAQRRQALLDLVRRKGLGLLPWTDTLRQWQARVELLRQQLGDPWPDVSDAGLLQSLDQWLAPYLDKVTRLSHFRELDLAAMLQTLLPWPLPQTLEELAPSRIAVPSGSQIAIDYTRNPPVLAVKLQEMFGCRETPSIANGQVKLTLHLLSPARRPLQVTQDLAGFWQGSYQQVKKEMKGRYPKHPWPDDPLVASATARTKATAGTKAGS